MTPLKIFIIVFAIFACFSRLYAAEVVNEDVRQVGNRVVFDFDLAGDRGEDTEVSLSITIRNKKYTMNQLHLQGDFGRTKAGKGKKIYWNVLQDFPKGISATYDWELLAIGSRASQRTEDEGGGGLLQRMFKQKQVQPTEEEGGGGLLQRMFRQKQVQPTEEEVVKEKSNQNKRINVPLPGL